MSWDAQDLFEPGAATELLQRFGQLCGDRQRATLRRKLGLASEEAQDDVLIDRWLGGLKDGKVDFTLAFRRLCDVAVAVPGTDPLSALRALFAVDGRIEG